jgi:SAM-dependent methyltransferase
MSSKSRQQLELWLKNQDIDYDKVLDIGGCQLPLQGRTKSWNVKEYLFMDLEQPHEGNQKPDIIWDINKDLRDLYPLMIFEYIDYFDAIFMLEVLEYVWDPVIAIRNCGEMLKKGGKLYLSMHFLYPIHKPIGIDYLRYTPDGITKVLTECGFKVNTFVDRTMTKEGFNKYVEMCSIEGMKRPYDVNKIGGIIIAEKL